MIAFKPITIKDKEIITSYTLHNNWRDCSFSFANLCCWQFLNDYHYAIIDGMLVIRFYLPEDMTVYSMPMGNGPVKEVIEKLKLQAEETGSPLYLYGMNPETKEILEKDFPTLFEYHINRDYFDYIYLRKDLAELKGKNYQPKRNHVNKFTKEYPYEYVPLALDLIPQCLKLEAEWCIHHGCEEDEGLRNERKAMIYAFRNFEELNIQGGVLRINNRIVAFTYGAPVNEDTFDIIIEKADTDIDGAYSMINREFAAHLPEQYIYVNREEDLGIPGLRQAKLSYHPAILLEKVIASRHK